MATLADLEVQNARLTLMVERMWPWFVAGGGGSASVAEIIDDRVSSLLVAGAIFEATIDFGATPTDYATVTVVDASVGTGSVFLCGITGGSTADNDADSHAFLALDAVVTATPAAGSVTFAVQTRDVSATGQFKIRYTYS